MYNGTDKNGTVDSYKENNGSFLFQESNIFIHEINYYLQVNVSCDENHNRISVSIKARNFRTKMLFRNEESILQKSLVDS